MNSLVGMPADGEDIIAAVATKNTVSHAHLIGILTGMGFWRSSGYCTIVCHGILAAMADVLPSLMSVCLPACLAGIALVQWNSKNARHGARKRNAKVSA